MASDSTAEAAELGKPEEIYATRLATLTEEAHALRRRADLVSHARLGLFVAAVVAAFLVFGKEWVHGGVLAGLVFGFFALVVWHDQLLRALAKLQRAMAFCERGLARIAGRWTELPAPLDVAIPPDHPYCEDLDCLGAGSLLHRISETRTHSGQQRLAAWLLAPAAGDEILARQAAIAELSPNFALRESVASVGDEALSVVDEGGFVRWGSEPPILGDGSMVRGVAILLSAATLASLAALVFTSVGPLPLVIALFAQLGFAGSLRARVRRVLAQVETPERELEFLTELLEPLERGDFSSPRLRGLQSSLLTPEGKTASVRIAELRKLVDLLDARRNQLFAPISGLLLWSTHLAYAIEGWKRANGAYLSEWVEALADLEALLSLAGYAFERPEDVFPEIVTDGGLCFSAEGIAHPLLGSETGVRNDIAFGESPRLVIVSGSNMSGKSTLLRAVGVNALLALAGAPVCARRLRVSPLQLAASVHVQDSLLAGHSRFYAEVRRLSRVYELATDASTAPVLYLLDEILHGTNAEERRVGAEKLVRALLETPAAGLVTTHDLALTELAASLAPRASNAHFVDEMGSDGLRFDYQLRQGPATTGNALALMRSLGLPV